MKVSRCEDEKMRYRPPLLEEPCAQTLSGKIGKLLKYLKICFDSSGVILGSRSCAHNRDPISFNNLNLVNFVIRNLFHAYKQIIYVCTLAFQQSSITFL